MRNDNCRRYDQAVYEESPIDGPLRAHAATCPRCSALAAAAGLSVARVEAPLDDALTKELMALAAQAAARHCARRARQRWLAPALIGAGTYLFTACAWLALLLYTPAPTGPVLAAPQAPSAGLGLPALPAPSPIAVISVFVACLFWIAAAVALARQREEAPT